VLLLFRGDSNGIGPCGRSRDIARDSGPSREPHLRSFRTVGYGTIIVATASVIKIF
jgi:hypothetical protein